MENLRQAIVEKLAHQVRRLEVAGREQSAASGALSSGCGALDRHLPGGGYQGGTVIEYLRAIPACGASYLALSAAREAMRATEGFLIVVDWLNQFYPPAVAALGIDLQHVVFVRPQSHADGLWAIDQALRCSAVAAVVAQVDRLDDRAARRMQLAAEEGGGRALLVRSAAARHEPSWAEVQWVVRPLLVSASGGYGVARQVQVQLARVRGGKAGATVYLEIDAERGELREVVRHEQTGAMHLAAQLARAARASGPDRAGQTGAGTASA